MPASDKLCRVKLIQDTATCLLLSVSLLTFSFLLPFFLFCPLSPGRASARHTSNHSMLLAASPSSEAAEMFFPSSLPPSPSTRLIVTVPSWCTAIRTPAKVFDLCHLPGTSHFSISLSPVLHLSVANLMLAHVFLRQYTCAVVTGTHTDTPEVSLK